MGSNSFNFFVAKSRENPAKPANQDSRTEAITGFLKAARQALAPPNVMVAADICGYVMWNLDDTGIGQKVDAALDAVDVVCPMLYPSAYQFGIPHDKNPVQNTYQGFGQVRRQRLDVLESP